MSEGQSVTEKNDKAPEQATEPTTQAQTPNQDAETTQLLAVAAVQATPEHTPPTDEAAPDEKTVPDEQTAQDDKAATDDEAASDDKAAKSVSDEKPAGDEAATEKTAPDEAAPAEATADKTEPAADNASTTDNATAAPDDNATAVTKAIPGLGPKAESAPQTEAAPEPKSTKPADAVTTRIAAQPRPTAAATPAAPKTPPVTPTKAAPPAAQAEATPTAAATNAAPPATAAKAAPTKAAPPAAPTNAAPPAAPKTPSDQAATMQIPVVARPPAPRHIPPQRPAPGPNAAAAQGRPTPQGPKPPLTHPPLPAPRPLAAPQRIPPAAATAGTGSTTHRRRWLAGAVAAVVAIAALFVGLFLENNSSADNSPQAQIKNSIDGFAEALESGDIATLRKGTCGKLADFYRSIPDQQFADVHRTSVQQKKIPTIHSVDTIQITGRAALAQVTASVPAEPANKSARSVNLQNTDSGWKVCDQPESSR